ncbi:hypothetical protein [Burkholderia cepacia]|uniref:hypothetical protein n=1 Tax=Burkholderia cepacia TaxID=292 RepID=UPI001CF23282|nr:hypothetical protein [Burkholderia cepacia]MCA8026430.1 hypothetical protein [Burkholderia cepacia]
MIDMFSPVFGALTGILETPTPFLSRIPEESFSDAREGYDVDLPPDAVREVRAVPLLGVDAGGYDRQSVCAVRAHADGAIEIIGMCEYTGDADSDGGECD